MAVQDYKINYKSDFVLTINGDAGWATQFCIKFWTGMPSQAYFVGFNGVKYVNCRVGDTPTQLLVMFDDHHLPIGPLKMQIAYHTTIEEFPGSVFDEVTNARDVIVTIDGTDYQVLLDFTGEDAPELEFDLPAYANEAERIQNELQRQQNEAERIAAELQREQATAAAVQGAENVNAQLAGNILTVTNRNGVSTSVNTKGERGVPGPVGPEGPQGETGISIVDFSPKSQTATTIIYTATFSDGHTQDVAIPKGPKGDTGATGPTGPQGPQGQTGVSITGLVKTGETETDTIYNVTFSNGTTQQVSIPKGEKGDQGPVGPQGPQGPMGDVAVITPEQQAAFTMYSTTGQNTDGPMTQKAVTDNLVAGSISYDNSASGLASNNVQNAIDEIAIESSYEEQFAEFPLSVVNKTAVRYETPVNFVEGHAYKIKVIANTSYSNPTYVILQKISGDASGQVTIFIIPAGSTSAEYVYHCEDDTLKYFMLYASGNHTINYTLEINEVIRGYEAEKVKYDNSDSYLASNNVQGAVDELAIAARYEELFAAFSLSVVNKTAVRYETPVNFVEGHAYKIKVIANTSYSNPTYVILQKISGDASGQVTIFIIPAGSTSAEYVYHCEDDTLKYFMLYASGNHTINYTLEIDEVIRGCEAERVKYNNSQSGLISGNVQGALDELADVALAGKKILAIDFIGDSLTAQGSPVGYYPSKVIEYLGIDGFNWGVGGENAGTILGRCDGIPYKLASDVTIPAGTTQVQIYLTNIYGQYLLPLLQRYNSHNIVIDGIEGTLTTTQTNPAATTANYYFQRNESGSTYSAKSGDDIFVQDSKDTLNPYRAKIIWIGQNGGFDINSASRYGGDITNQTDRARLIDMIKTYIDVSGCMYYMVLSAPQNTNNDLETDFAKAFGNRYFNVRKYMVNHGIDDAIALGYLSASSYPTQQDITDMSNGVVPSSLRSDSVHFTQNGYYTMAYALSIKLKEVWNL